jgi:hypothetical protein
MMIHHRRGSKFGHMKRAGKIGKTRRGGMRRGRFGRTGRFSKGPASLRRGRKRALAAAKAAKKAQKISGGGTGRF